MPHPFRSSGYDPPGLEELASVPWGGDGPDPLEELYNAAAAGQEEGR